MDSVLYLVGDIEGILSKLTIQLFASAHGQETDRQVVGVKNRSRDDLLCLNYIFIYSGWNLPCNYLNCNIKLQWNINILIINMPIT